MEKKIMKKLFAFVVTLILAAGMMGNSVMAASKGFVFKYYGVSVTMNGEAAKLIQKSGKPNKTNVKKSCAYEGKDRTYEYDNFILYTYSHSDNGSEYIGGITFLNDKVKTKEGIKIGSSYDDMVKKYGKGENNYGIYIFKKGNSEIQIEIKDNKVNNLRYLAK